jgi:predicted house-cleaning noncanonical NTP pyrophosphatase (MazG superfamily)
MKKEYFYIGKLFRNKITKKMQNQGAEFESRILRDDEIIPILIDKLIEEAKELQKVDPKDKKKFREEMADIKTVLKNIGESNDITEEELNEEAKQKKEKLGDFSERIFVEKAGIEENDPWLEYYRNNYKKVE